MSAHEGVSASPSATPFDLFEIRCWHESAVAMSAPHCHDDLELVMVDGSEPAYYEHLGRSVPLEPGQMTAFWAAYPHTLAQRSSGTVLRRLMVPTGLLLSRQLPEYLVVELLAGTVMSAPVDLAATEFRFTQWESDARSSVGEVRTAMLLEIEGWLRRIAPELRASACAQAKTRDAVAPRSLAVVASMCRYLVKHFHEPVRVADVARAVGVSDQYAMTVFHTTTGFAVTEYLTRCRVAEAQRLLVASEATVTDVAFASGFGSVSQFYDRFTARCGLTPRQYRLDMRA